MRYLLLVLALISITGLAHAEGGGGLTTMLVADGLTAPLHVSTPPGDVRIFVVEQPGTVRIIDNDRVLDRPFLDISDRLRFGGERGLLGLAFHPNYSRNGYFFVNYSEKVNGATRIERYRVSEDSNRADPASAQLVLRVEQPYSNHNGGHILFGPDGMLYVAMGDGGAGGDPKGHGQNRATLHGALLRIDIDSDTPYAIPTDNPFIGDVGGRDEIWAWGLRNPWRISFDGVAGLLYVADVGQDDWEEVTIVSAAVGGHNYGWNLMEGNHCFTEPRCDSTGLTTPDYVYSHDEGCSITGGLIYRGAAMPDLHGHYFFSDYCTGFLRSFRYSAGAVIEAKGWDAGNLGHVTSFGTDAAGELYITNSGGQVLKLVPAS